MIRSRGDKGYSKTLKKHFAYAIVGLIFLIGAITLYFNVSPTSSRWFPQCPFRLLTGWSCPGCGIQRALHALLHGHWGEALSYNYFFVISIPYAAMVAAAYVIRKTAHNDRLANFLECRTFALFYVVCFLIWFFVRNILNI